MLFNKGCDDILKIIKEILDLSHDSKKKIECTKKYISTFILGSHKFSIRSLLKSIYRDIDLKDIYQTIRMIV